MFARTLTIITAALLIFSAGTARADDEDDKREKVREKVRTMVMAKIIEELDLDEAGATKLFPVLNKYHDEIAKLHKDSGEARREIKKMLDAAKADDAKVNKQIDRIVANRSKIATLEADMFKDVRKILTPVQSAKLVVILPMIRDRLERKIRNAASGGGRGRGKHKAKEEGKLWDQLDIDDPNDPLNDL